MGIFATGPDLYPVLHVSFLVATLEFCLVVLRFKARDTTEPPRCIHRSVLLRVRVIALYLLLAVRVV